MRARLVIAALLAWPLCAHAQDTAPAPNVPRHSLAPDGATLLASQRAITDVVARIEPALVNVRRFVRDEKWWADATGSRGKAAGGWKVVPDQDLLYPDHRPLPGASGFVITEDGYILTLNRLVVLDNGDEPDVVDCAIGEQHYKASIIAREPTIDLAILKVNASMRLPYAPLGNSADLDPGSFLLAFGIPDGTRHVIAPGLVTRVPNRECYQDQMSATYVQTSMAFDGGALGGPVVNGAGDVVGIATNRGAHAPVDTLDLGPGFALPTNLAMAIYQSLLARQSRESPWLGVSVLKMNRDARRAAGAPDSVGILIDNVFTPSPAATLGVRVGDVLTHMRGEMIRTVYDFQRILYAVGVGRDVKLVLVRQGERLEKTAHIEKRPPEAITR